MTIAECLVSIYKRFEKTDEAPDTSGEDYIVRMEYVNAAIDKWENELGIQWKELFSTLSQTLVSGVYDDNTGTGTLQYFKRPAGYLWIGEDKYQYVRPERVEKEVEMNAGKKIYTVTGSKGTYAIHVYPSTSGAFTLNYVKRAQKYSTGVETEEIEMSDPEFCIYDVLAQLYLEDDNTTQASVVQQVAGAKMDAMKLENERDPFNNNNNFPDDDFDGFGN